MDVLLNHIEASARNMHLHLRDMFVRSFIDTAEPDWVERTIELAYLPDLILEKASRILSVQEFNVHQGADGTSDLLRGTLRKSYPRNEGYLATLDGRFSPEIQMRFDVEIVATDDSPSATTIRVSRRLMTWLEEFERLLRADLATVKDAYKEVTRVDHDVILAPGERLKSAFDGQLTDYSGCATLHEVDRLRKTRGDGKVLPLGVYAFDHKPEVAQPETVVYVGRFGDKPMEFNGTLVVAPQNSGKTRLIVRWALAANRAGYNLFIVDVKGNLLPHLRKAGLQGDVHFLSTDPSLDGMGPERSSCFNILEELDPTTPAGRSEIKAICEALLPDYGGEDAQFRPIRLRSLVAIVCIRKLLDLHFQEISDLGDIYEMAADENRLYQCISALQKVETWQLEQNPDVFLPQPTSAFWITELAPLISPDEKRVMGGQREPRYSYASLTIHIITALMPFHRYGGLHSRTSGKSDFKLSDLDGAGQSTIVLAAREHDGEEAQVVSAIILKRLEQILKRRFSVEQPDRPILLLLDETRRIKGFSPGKYITFAREAKAGCVLVYQSIEQIESEKEIIEVLENVGIQIYLRSVTGKTADRLVDMLPKRFRPQFSRGQTSGSGFSRSSQVSQEEVPCLSKSEMFKLPAGEYPALVFIKDYGDGKPFLVDMSERRLGRISAAT